MSNAIRDHLKSQARVLGLGVLMLLGLAVVREHAAVNAQTTPLPRAHAHNDYEHERPLLDALDHGFCSVEADVHLVDGELLVAHDREDVVPGRTLQSLYLAPLRERVRANQGAVYPDGPPVTLLIDVKSEAEPTYRALQRVLRTYADILTIYAGETVDAGPVRAIISGNRARSLMEAEAIRYAAYDGRLEDLAMDPSPAFVPLISSHWGEVSSWQGDGPMPASDRRRLQEVVDQAHAQGRRIRFWATRDRPAVWRALLDAGVDLLNADDLEGLQQFLLEERESR